tara:strand:+ start:521 stop:868 length:348 start_codon:yes stop_codon:yes gene_type:complete
MIDTDKYEGHTPAPWKQAKPKDSNPRITTQFCGDEIIVNTGATSWEADTQLIADAPLLLAEVLRLRSLDDLLRSMEKDGITASGYDYLLAEVLRLQKQVDNLRKWLKAGLREVIE